MQALTKYLTAYFEKLLNQYVLVTYADSVHKRLPQDKKSMWQPGLEQITGSWVPGFSWSGPLMLNATSHEMGQALEAQDWRCCTCGNWNRPWRTVCNIRNCRSHGPAWALPLPGDWQCENCGNNNFAYRLACNRCQTTRPLSGTP